MTRRLKIPLLLDRVRVDSLEHLRELNEHPRVHRDVTLARFFGPLLARGRLGRVVDTFKMDGTLLPAFRNRDAAGRAERQAALERRLQPLSDSLDWADEEIGLLARSLRQDDSAQHAGPPMQQICGRLFRDDYRADERSYAAAVLLDGYPRANLFKALWWRLTGRVTAARNLLWDLADADPDCAHATTIAFHNLIASLDRMRAFSQDPGRRDRLDANTVAGQCLVAPETVLRRGGDRVDLGFLDRPTREGTLFTIELRAIHRGSGDSGTALQRDHWARCPAHAFVPALLAAIWRRAYPEQGTAP